MIWGMGKVGKWFIPRFRTPARLGMGVMMVMLLAACHEHTAAPAVHHDPKPAVGVVAYSSGQYGIHFDYPTDWERQKSDDFALLLVPAKAKRESASFTLDVPHLPIHIPGLIPMGSVKEGFLNDLRKRMGTIETRDLPNPSIPDADVRFLRSSWTAEGKTMTQTALLMTHHDRVYILRWTADSDHEKAMEVGMRKIIDSLKW